MTISANTYQAVIHIKESLLATNKKGFTDDHAHKPLYFLVGGTGFEPVTSTV